MIWPFSINIRQPPWRGTTLSSGPDNNTKSRTNGLVSATFGFGLDETLLCRCIVKLDRCPPNCRLAINMLWESGKCDWAGMAGDWEVVVVFGLCVTTCGGGGSSAACHILRHDYKKMAYCLYCLQSKTMYVACFHYQICAVFLLRLVKLRLPTHLFG